MAERFIPADKYRDWLEKQVELRRPYWYGCYYNPCTEALLQRKAEQYPSHYKEKRMPKYRKNIADGQIAGDCVNGAIKGAIWSELGKRQPVYNSHDCPDTSADGMFEYCKKLGMPWGAINSIPEKPMIAVRFAGHVGIYVGDGYVIEWRGFDYGCVRTGLKDRKWTHWYELPWVIYDEKPTSPVPDAGLDIFNVNSLGSRLLKRGCTGDDVRTLQQLLMQIGYKLPKYGDDGDFGTETETAVKEFQRANGLQVDGKYGSLSHAELMGIMAEQAAQEDPDDDVENDVNGYVVITGNDVYVREGNNKQTTIITIVHKGDHLMHVATAANGWHAVKLNDGRSGWVGPLYSRLVVPAA